MLCVKQVRRRRLLRLSGLWLLFVSAYLIADSLYPKGWQSSESAEEEWTQAKQVFAPFLPNESRSVVLLTYQRGGSTLFGNMFNSNPEMFYIFEPLDALYTDMYGTARGWNVPAEITNYWNGTQRNLSQLEIKEVAFFLQSIFQCQMDQLPISFFVHPFYFLYNSEYRQLGSYVSCIDKIDKLLDLCLDHKPEIEGFCGSRFGEKSDETSLECYKMLWKGDYNIKNATSRIRQAVFNYNACIRRLRSRVDEACSPIMRNVCADRQLRAVKCVRATMDSMEPLLRTLPNFRVVHLMRDPRGVVLSRMKFHDSTRNRYSDSGNDTMVREAELYCRTVVRDINRRRQLETVYPGKIFSVLYDDFVSNIEGYTDKIYQFLDLQMPNSTVEWVREAQRGRNGRNATSIASAWQEQLSYRDSTAIARRCYEFFRLVKDVTPL